jgi:sirohydrochlorin cobaltochelatase
MSISSVPSANSALILFAHGARDPAWAEPMLAVRELMLRQQPHIRVELAFLEQMSPTLKTCIDTLVQDAVTNIVIYPLFIAAGSHLKKDLPALITELTQQYPNLTLSQLPAAGEQTGVQQAIAKEALRYLGFD